MLRVRNRLTRRIITRSTFLLCAVVLSAYVSVETQASEVENMFSSSYFEARDKFLDAALNCGALIHHWENPSQGPEGQAMYTDVALIGQREADNFIVVISGTHGVEGFTGSAIQTGLLRHVIRGELPQSTGILFIHALNPYGFAHLRRVNEDNVDLNRNFLDDSARKKFANQGYSTLAEPLFPPDLGLISNAKCAASLLTYWVKHETKELKEAISGGQLTHPDGLFYGGSKAVWSNRILHEILNTYLSRATRVIVIDIHTGLGCFAAAEMITNASPDSGVYKRAVHIWGNMVRSTDDGSSVSTHLTGSLKLAIPNILKSAEVTALSLEFGTVSPLKVLIALRAENWLHHNQTIDNHKSMKIKRQLLEAFYPQNTHWRERVWQQGREVFLLALKKM